MRYALGVATELAIERPTLNRFRRMFGDDALPLLCLAQLAPSLEAYQSRPDAPGLVILFLDDLKVR